MKNSMKSFLMLALAFAVTSCGTNNDPLELFDQGIPELNTISSTTNFTSLTVGYSPTTPYWGFPTFTAAASVLAPARGKITEIGVDTNFPTSGYYVKIVHSGRVATKIVGINQAVLVRTGDFVAAGQSIGTYFATGSVFLQVILDGRAVCPLSYMSDSFRSTFYTGISNVNPCR